MFRIAILDNGSLHLEALRALVPSADIFSYDHFSPAYLDAYDLVILSGGHSISVMRHPKEFAREMRFIRNRKKPMIGICLGFELIAAAFGGELGELPRKESGILSINATADDPVLRGAHLISGYEGHRWALKDAPDALVCIAYSKDGAEIIKHKNLPIYGFQFHPEISEGNDGQIIFNNFLRIARATI